MTYRDGLQAALEKISSLERIITDLKRQITELKELSTAKTTSSKTGIKLGLLTDKSKLA